MPKEFKLTFQIHAVVALVFGAPLLLFPGRFLEFFGWAPVDPILSRVLGAALLALAWSSFRVWQTGDKKQAAILIEMEGVFCILGVIGVLRHMLTAFFPDMVWFVLAIFTLFAAAWIALWLTRWRF